MCNNDYNLKKCHFKQFQPTAKFCIETCYLICTLNQMTGFWIKCNAEQKWVNPLWEKVSLHEKWSFPWRICLVNVTKSAVSCGFDHIYCSCFVQCNMTKIYMDYKYKSIRDFFNFCAVLLFKSIKKIVN